MRKALVIFSVFVFVLAFAQRVRAQEEEQVFDFKAAYQDFVSVKDIYDSRHSDYQLARAQYLQAGTLVSETKARDATALMLEARDDVIITYMTALRLKLTETAGVSDVVRSGLLNRIDTEINWFRDHKSRISSAGNLESLVEDSDEARDRFLITEVVAYETLVTVANAKVSVLRDDMVGLVSDVRQKTFEIAAAGDHDVTNADRWITEVENKITRSLDRSIQAEADAQGFSGERFNKRTERYNSIISSLQEAQELLRDASRNMKEVLKIITTIQ